MRTLIIPCAGRKTINGAPRWQAIMPNGNIVLSECIKNVNYQSFDRIIVTILADDEREYDATKLIKKATASFGNVEILVLKEKTEGPAQTVFESITQKNISGQIAIKDIGTIISEGDNPNPNFIFGIDLLKYESDLQNVRNKSFITVNEQNDVMDIIEKTVKSGIISLGYYGFEDANDFQWAFRSIRKEEKSLNGIYISHIIDYLIAVKQRVFTYVEAPKYLSIETDKDYSKIVRDHFTYILDLAHLNEDSFPLIQQAMAKGCSFIFLCPKHLLFENEAKIKKYGINSDKITCYSGNIDPKMIASSEELKDLFLSL